MTERRNPEALHEAAAGWRDMGTHLGGLVRDLDRHVGTAAAANWQGPAGEAFAAEWHRLKRSVDETLPVFELAAADLESAASQGKEAHAGADSGAHDSAPAASQDDGSGASGTQTAYGFMALGQLATSLGGAFRGKGGRGGGQGRRPPVTAHWETSGAPQGPDPFGPPQAGDAKRARGGAGVAKGVRTGAHAAEAVAADATPEAPARRPAKPAASSDATTSAGATSPAAPGSPPPTSEGSAAGTGKDTPEAPDARQPATKDPSPDVRRHGAFG
ncbi:WXG100 family type VII secretion target [Streptomyces sp. NPDC018019]|uniref:WXG100 family type VII secretion target n=1 Tax=Streptomyces sp. NPDC018019 TaxID=3365030 RepID=UPI0037A3C85A